MEYSKQFFEKDIYLSLFPALLSETGKIYKGQAVANEFIMPIEQVINDEDNEKCNWLLIGNGGAGKTFALFLLWNKYLNNRKNKIIYVSLSEYNRWNKENFLSTKICTNYFENNKEEYRIFMKKARKFLAEEKVFFLLDGFNEILQADKQNILSEIKDLAQSINICIIITSRYDLRNYYGFNNFKKLEIVKLSDEQINDFLAEKKVDKEKITPNLRQIFGNPMMLLLYVESTEIINRDKNIKWLEFFDKLQERGQIDITFGEVLWNYFESCIAKVFFDTKNIEVAICSKIVIFYIMPQLCWHLFKKKQFEFSREELSNVIENIDSISIKKRFFKQLEMIDNENQLLDKIDLKYTLRIITHYIDIVSEKATSTNIFFNEVIYMIKHHYYRDFFIALYVVNEIEVSQGIPDVIVEENLPLFISELVGNIFREHYNVPLLENGKWSFKYFKHTPLHYILSRISEMETRDVGLALQNILTIWERARNGYIIGETFDNIELSNCNFSNLIFSVKDKDNEYYSKFNRIKNTMHLKQFLTEGHLGVVNYLSFSPDFKLLASASTDCDIKVWQVNGELLSLYKTFSGHKRSVKCVKILSNGYEMLSCSIDGTIRKWNILSDESEILFKIEGNINYFDINEQENKIIVCQNNPLILEYDIETQEVATYRGHTGVVNMAIYISDKILSCSQSGEVFEWDTVEYKISYKYPKEDYSINCIVYGKNTKMAVWATSKGKIICYNQSKMRFEKQGKKTSILFLSMNIKEDKFISCGDDRIIHEWKIIDDDLVEISSIIGHVGSINCALYNKESNKIYSGSWDNTIQIWEALLGVNISKIKGTRNWINYLYMNRKCDKILVSCWNGDIQEWNIKARKCVRIYHGHTNVVNKAIYNLDETRVISCSYDKTIREWDVNTGYCCRILQGHSDCVTDIVYNSDNSKLVSSSFDRKVIEWKLYEDEAYEYDIVGIHMDYVNGIKYSSGEKRILSWSDDGYIIEWEKGEKSYKKFDLRIVLDKDGFRHEIKYATYLNEKEILFVSWYGIIGKIVRDNHKIEILYELEIPNLQIESVYFYKMSNLLYLCGSDYGIYKVSLDEKKSELFSMHENLVKSVLVADEGEMYVGGWEGGVYYWKNDYSDREKLFCVLMGIYVDSCEFNYCTFKDEKTSKMISAYNGKLNSCRIEK